MVFLKTVAVYSGCFCKEIMLPSMWRMWDILQQSDYQNQFHWFSIEKLFCKFKIKIFAHNISAMEGTAVNLWVLSSLAQRSLSIWLVFLFFGGFLGIFKEQLLFRAPLEGCFWITRIIIGSHLMKHTAFVQLIS